MQTNIYAYTEHCNYPGYISLNERKVDGTVSLAVRSGGGFGATAACLDIPKAELIKFAQAILAKFGG